MWFYPPRDEQNTNENVEYTSSSSSSVFPVVAMSYILSGSGDEAHGAVQGRFITV